MPDTTIPVPMDDYGHESYDYAVAHLPSLEADDSPANMAAHEAARIAAYDAAMTRFEQATEAAWQGLAPGSYRFTGYDESGLACYEPVP